ncbi:MAG: polyhydroxyalkanoic acid system family protein [Kofleriaceae bacterium]|nr:polyhydroxyalkanoic acid system family protein [Myxococcales bacterium]MCB9570696.1 polyhydroxyalkanoic acid system family protein [Kofleriaceae bacterium]
MEIDYKHDLPEDEARTRLEILGEYLHNRHGIRVQWLDPNKATFSGKYMVVKIDGELTFGQGVVRFRGHDPGFLWRKRAQEYIAGKLRVYLDKSKPVADLPRG